VTVTLTLAQANALLFACSNTLEEPANFEKGTGNERVEGALKRAQAKIIEAVLLEESGI
jgi:hypothetical protein